MSPRKTGMAKARPAEPVPLRALCWTLGIAAALVALALTAHQQFIRLLAIYSRAQLATVADDRAEALLGQTAQLGDAGIPVLVEALGSERQSVARAGSKVLWQEVRQWERLRAREASPKLAILAESLATRVDQFPATARIEAADMARRILAWPLDRQVVNAGRVTGHCEAVIRAASPAVEELAQRRFRQHAQYVASLGRQAGGDPIASGADRAPLITLRPLGAGEVPGGGLPVGPLPSLGSGADAGLEETVGLEPGEPRSLLGPLPDRRPEQPQGVLGSPDQGWQPREARSSGDRPLAPEPSDLRSLALSSGAGVEPGEGQGSSGLGALPTVELMRRLHWQDAPMAAAAERELSRRGFGKAHLALARRLFHPDPGVRRQLVRDVFGVPNLDAAPWLLQLAGDADPQVRLAAIAMLATAGDPALLEKVQEIARTDPDPQIRRQAELIARDRSASDASRR